MVEPHRHQGGVETDQAGVRTGARHLQLEQRDNTPNGHDDVDDSIILNWSKHTTVVIMMMTVTP